MDKDNTPIIYQPCILLFSLDTIYLTNTLFLKVNVHMILNSARNPGLPTQRKEWGHQVLGLRRKSAVCGLQHWYL